MRGNQFVARVVELTAVSSISIFEGCMDGLTVQGRGFKLLAGTANSLSSGLVVVPDPTKGRHGAGKPPSGSGSGADAGTQYGGEAQGPNR